MADPVGTPGARGITYEALFTTMCSSRGYIRGLEKFKLEHQASSAGKFDDVVFYDGAEYQMVQLKLKKYQNMKISHRQLFNETFNTDYNLLKYVVTVHEANLTDKFKDKIKCAVVFTNININLNQNKQMNLKMNSRPIDKVWYGEVKSLQVEPITLDSDAIFDMSKSFPNAKYYKFDKNPEVVGILKRQAETTVEKIREEKKQNFSWWTYITSLILSLIPFFFLSENVVRKRDQQKKLKKQEEILVKSLESLIKDEVQIKTALGYIIYAVGQPGDEELADLVKEEIKEHFKLESVDTTYILLEYFLRIWCERKEPFDPSTANTQTTQPFVIYEDIKKFLQNHIKNISFGVKSPTSSFSGRLKELHEIRDKLVDKPDLIVSQTLAICGLGGIGKTQSTKRFIHKFGKSDFYGRVIWIEAESDETVKNAFTLLAEKLEIKDRRNKVISTIIDEVFQYFDELKVLFVFDNYDVNPGSENLVGYCRKTASDSTKKSRPYFIFTSRNRECLPGVSSVDLSVLTIEDAKELIKNGSIDIQVTEEDVEKLAEILQCFPLALQQAIAYINEQHRILSVSGDRYEIKNFFNEFDRQKETLLDYQFSDDFGEYGKTTFITWNVTFNAIEADELNGDNAIQVLKILSYLYADRIDSKMFLPLFQNEKECNGRAFLLLEKYSLITKIDKDSSCYQIHRLVQAVVQLKFKENQETILEQAIKSIHPFFYEYKIKPEIGFFELEETLTFEKLLHCNTIEIHTKKFECMSEKFKDFFEGFHELVFVDIAIRDDVDEIKALNFSEKYLKDYIKRKVEEFMRLQCNNLIMYFIQKEILRLNEQFSDNFGKNKSLIEISKEKDNLYIFKFLIEKGADFTKVLDFASVELISVIINGKSDLVQSVIDEKDPDKNCKILEECLFYATLFNHETIVKLLLDKDIDPNFSLNRWSPIFAAAIFNYVNILQILLQKCQKEHLKFNLFELTTERYFESTEIYKKCFNRYRELGDVNDQNFAGDSLLYCSLPLVYLNNKKLKIAQFLLDNGADPTLTNDEGKNAFTLTILGVLNSLTEMHEIYNKIILSEMSPEKFITVLTTGLFKIKNWKNYKKTKVIFDELVETVGDINVRNQKGETLLINYVKDVQCTIENVKFLVENGADVSVKDNNGKTTLYYAMNSGDDDTFMYLLSKVSFVDEDILLQAVKEDKLSTVNLLLEKHFSADYIFSHGKSIIEVAVDYASLQIIFFLKSQFVNFRDEGGNVNKKYSSGRNLLIKYIQNLKNCEADLCEILASVKFLVENGVDVDAEDNEGGDALYYALDFREEKIFMYLLDKVISVDERIFINAIQFNKLSIVVALVPKYFNVNHNFVCLRGRTPLILAVDCGAINIQRYLESKRKEKQKLN